MQCRRLRANTHRMGCGWACADKGTAHNALSEQTRGLLTNEGWDTFLFASASVTFFIPPPTGEFLSPKKTVSHCGKKNLTPVSHSNRGLPRSDCWDIWTFCRTLCDAMGPWRLFVSVVITAKKPCDCETTFKQLDTVRGSDQKKSWQNLTQIDQNLRRTATQ